LNEIAQILITKPCAKLVMLLIDISVWISIFRDRSGQVQQQLEVLIASRNVLLTRFTQIELLQGSLNEKIACTHVSGIATLALSNLYFQSR